MYINYPGKFTVKIDYVHNLLENVIKEGQNRKKKERKKNYNQDIYKIIDEEYAQEQTS